MGRHNIVKFMTAGGVTILKKIPKRDTFYRDPLPYII